MTGMTKAQWKRVVPQLLKLGHDRHAYAINTHLVDNGKGKLPSLHLCTNPNLGRCRQA